MNFRVALDVFRGPLDLLLYLVRKHEVDLGEIPIAQIADQYMQHLEVLEAIDVNAVADFLELASTLIEMKSRLVLPHAEEEEEAIEEAREQLVERLLEYKRYKDAASMLEEQGREWRQRYPRMANDLARRAPDPAEQPIAEVELWDLVSALGRVMKDSAAAQPTSIVYDDTPIHVYMRHIHERIVAEGRVAFSAMFARGMHKSAMIGMFLAILELVRHHGITAEQDDLHGDIWILPGAGFANELNLDEVTDYEHTNENETPS